MLPASPLELVAAQPDPVPKLVGSNREEAAFFLLPDIYPGDPYPPSDRARDSNTLVGPQNGPRARKLYLLSEYDSAHFFDDPVLWHDDTLLGGYQFPHPSLAS